MSSSAAEYYSSASSSADVSSADGAPPKKGKKGDSDVESSSSPAPNFAGNVDGDYQDWYWTVVWIVFWVVCIIIGIVGIANLSSQESGGGNNNDDSDTSDSNDNNNNDNDDAKKATNYLLTVVILAAALAFVFTSMFVGCWMLIFKYFAETIIYIVLGTMWVVLLLVCILCIGASMASDQTAGLLYLGIVFGILLLAYSVYLYLIRKRIPFSGALLSNTVVAIFRFPATIAVSFIMIVPFVLFLALFVFCVIGAAYIGNSNAAAILIIFCSFTYSWTGRVIENINQVVTQGTVATSYLVAEPRNPTWGALKRATSLSLGTVIYGSFILTVVDYLRSALESAAEQGGVFCALCVACLLRHIQAVIEYLTFYAFTQVALYGCTFCEAADRTRYLFVKQGLTVFVNDLILAPVLFVAAFTSALLGMILTIACLFSYIFNNAPNDFVIFIVAIILAFIIPIFVGIWTSQAILTVIKAGVGATIVTFGMEPQSMRKYNREAFDNLYEKVPEGMNFSMDGCSDYTPGYEFTDEQLEAARKGEPVPGVAGSGPKKNEGTTESFDYSDNSSKSSST